MQKEMVSNFERNKAVNKNVVIPKGCNWGSSTHPPFCNKTTNDKRGRFPIETLGNDASFMSRCFDGGGFTPALVIPQCWSAGYSAGYKCGFTLIELLVVVLIIGILAAVALPKYQLAVDKARYSALIPVTKALAEAQVRAKLAGNTEQSFDILDVELPAGCTGGTRTLSCNNGQWGCALHASGSYPRCSDYRINATYYYLDTTRICYAHTTDTNDRANRLCQAMTGKKTPFVTEDIKTFKENIPMNGYQFD